MKRHFRFRKWGMVLSLLLAILLTGCQAVSGVDLNQMILKQLDITSQEESGSFELTVDWNEQYLEFNEDPEFEMLTRLFSKVKLDIQEAKVDADDRMLVKGALTLGGKSPIHFGIQIDEIRMYLEADGFKQPLVIDLDEITDGSWSEMRPDLDEGEEFIISLVKEAAVYFVNNLPNPPKLQVSQELTDVGGISQMLTKVHAEIDGEQLGEWLIQYVDALVQDADGLRDMLRAVAKLISELNPELLTTMESPEDEALPTEEDLESFVEDVYQDLYSVLQEVQSELAEFKDEAEWKMIFDKGIVLKMDHWLDDKLFIRKSDVELVIAPAALKIPFSPVHGVTLRLQSERWNVNGDVQVPSVNAPEGAWRLENMTEMTNHKLLRLLEEDSVMYDLLKNDFEIDDSSFMVSPYNFYGTAPFISEDGTLLVPVRDTIEKFEITIEYDLDTREIRFYDEGTGQDFVLRIGSSAAEVNGNTVQLTKPLQLVDNYSYMAADDLFQMMKATYTYETDEWDDIWVDVERDL